MPDSTDEDNIAVSVIVPACGRLDLLDRCLDALMRQALDPRHYEIVVVDDEPNHNTLHLVSGWRSRSVERGPRLSYVANPGPAGPASARNRGWRTARAPILAFTTDDAVPDPRWLAAGLAAFGDGADVVCGSIQASAPARAAERQLRAPGPEEAGFTSASCFFRKHVLEGLDGFDEHFSLPRAGDADMYFRLLEQGVRIVRAPDALVDYPLPPPPWGASLLQIRHAVFDALLYKKHPALYRQMVEPRPCWNHYAITGLLLLALAGLLAGLPVLAGLGWAAWLALTARLCAQRLRGLAHTPPQLAEIILTSTLLPPLTVFWRLAGALRYRVRFA